MRCYIDVLGKFVFLLASMPAYLNVIGKSKKCLHIIYLYPSNFQIFPQQ